MTRHRRGGGGAPSKPVVKETGSINSDPPTPAAPSPGIKRENANVNLSGVGPRKPGLTREKASTTLKLGGRRKSRKTRGRKTRRGAGYY